MVTQFLAGNSSAHLAQRQRSSAECSTSANAFTPPDLIRERSFTRSKSLQSCSTSRARCHPKRSRSVTCSSSSTLTKQPLSVYKWPQRRPAVLDWLDQCVQDAVKQLDRAPFVQLIYSERADPLETHHVSRAETGPADLRQKVAGLLQNSTPDAVVLVHRLPSHANVSSAASESTVSASNVLTGLASHNALDQRGLQHGNSAAQNDILAGKVGECCDDTSTTPQNQIVPFSGVHDSPLPTSTHRQMASQRAEQITDYWGLVVQSKHRSEAEGFYILKTVRNTNPIGCQCTHYTLTQLQ